MPSSLALLVVWSIFTLCRALPLCSASRTVLYPLARLNPRSSYSPLKSLLLPRGSGLPSTEIILVSTIVSIVFFTMGMFFILRWCIGRGQGSKSVVDAGQEPKEQNFRNYEAPRILTAPGSAAIRAARQIAKPSIAENNSRGNRSSPPPVYSARRDSPALPPVNTQYQGLPGLPSHSPPDHNVSPLSPQDTAHFSSLHFRLVSPSQSTLIPTQTYSESHRLHSSSPNSLAPLEQRLESSRSILNNGINEAWIRAPTPPLRSPRRALSQVPLIRKPTTLPTVRKSTAQQPLQSPITSLQANKPDGVRRSDTGYSSHYGDSPNVSRRGSRRELETTIDEEDDWKFPVPGIDPTALYGDIMASSPFAMEWPQEARETRQECVGILTAAAERKRAGSAIAAHNYQDGNYIEQIVGQEEVGAANSARQGEIEGGLESRMQVDINALVPLPAPLRNCQERTGDRSAGFEVSEAVELGTAK